MAAVTLRPSISTGADVKSPRQTLLSNMEGHSVHIPNLKPVFSGWEGVSNPQINPGLEIARQEAATRIQRYLPKRLMISLTHYDHQTDTAFSLGFSGSKQKQLIAADFGLFASLWWPKASLEKLRMLTYLTIWIFTWDDELDEPAGEFSEEFDKAEKYRAHTLQFVGICLGLFPADPSFQPRNRIIQSFDVIGAALRTWYDEDQCRRLYNRTEETIRSTVVEQRFRLRGEVPTLEEFWAFRMGTSAVHFISAVNEYTTSSRLPQEVMESSPMKALWDETNIVISTTNDLFSFWKEVRLGGLDSVVPLTFTRTNDVQKAVSEAVAFLQSAKDRFDEAERALLSGYAKDDPVYQQLKQFIAVQRSNCVGNLFWR